MLTIVGAVGRRAILDRQPVVLAQRIGGVDRQRAGIAHLAVRADVAQRDVPRRTAAAVDDLPQLLVEACRAAVERVGAVVDRHLIRLAVEREPAPGDPVGEAPDGRAEILRVVEIVLEVVIAERDVGKVPGAIGQDQRLQRRPPGDDRRVDAVLVDQRHRRHRAAVGQRAEGRARHLDTARRHRRGQHRHGQDPDAIAHPHALLLSASVP